jgi:hypothetical protein
LRFQLHSLEEQWLEALDVSDKTASYEGDPAPAVDAINLVRRAQAQGYTLQEVQEVMGLLESRQYVAYDQRDNMLIRRIDNVAEIKSQVQEDLRRLIESVDRLERAVPEFDRRDFPIYELRDRLDAVGLREEAELLRQDIRRYRSDIKSFSASHVTRRREMYTQELSDLRSLVQAGVPPSLSRAFPASPLQDLLEKQRQNYADAFEKTLLEVRDLMLEGSKMLQNLPASSLDALALLQKALPEITKTSKRLKTRLQGYTDVREDMDAWRRLVEQMTNFTEQAQLITEKYGSSQWEQGASVLWQEARSEMMANPLTLPTLHQDVEQQLAELRQQLEAWLKNQREDYEQQRQRYEEALNCVGIEARLRIPFNAQFPAESYEALAETVQGHISRYCDDLQRQLNAILQKMRYATLVQHVNLTAVEEQTQGTIGKVKQLQEQLTSTLLRDKAQAESEVLQPLHTIFERAQIVDAEVQRAFQKRAPDGSEVELLDLLQTVIVKDEIDLYSLIMHQLDEGDEGIELDQLMEQLQSLFLKNQIGIRIRVL